MMRTRRNLMHLVLPLLVPIQPDVQVLMREGIHEHGAYDPQERVLEP